MPLSVWAAFVLSPFLPVFLPPAFHFAHFRHLCLFLIYDTCVGKSMVKFRHRCKEKRASAISRGYSFDVMRIGYTICPIYGLSELLFLFKNVILLFKNGLCGCAGRTITVFCPCGLDFLCMGCHFLGLVCPEDLAPSRIPQANQPSTGMMSASSSAIYFLVSSASPSVPTRQAMPGRPPLPLCCRSVPPSAHGFSL